MKKVIYSITLISLAFLTIRCHSNNQPKEAAATTTKRSAETEALYRNLKKMVADEKIMFGMANATTISYLGTNRKTDITQSDCKDITGSHPAFIESDFMWYAQDSAFMKRDIEAMHQAYQRGAVTGYAWHVRGMNSHSFYARNKNKTLADSTLVKNILANNDRKSNPSLNWLLTELDTLVIPIFKALNHPLTFRPFHEMNGNWFWWGCDNCSPEEYIKLYQLTVNYIRAQGVDNVLFVWSPDKKARMDYYPGDDYVDILGLDIYEPGVMAYSSTDSVMINLSIITDYAAQHDKVAALTETGCRKTDEGAFRYPDQYPDFWSNYVLNPIISHPKAKRIAWMMSWYGANWSGDFTSDFYIPYKGMQRPHSQEAIDDFKAFYNQPSTLFENDLPSMYK